MQILRPIIRLATAASAVAAFLVGGVADAETPSQAETSSRIAVEVGITQWPDLGDMQPFLGGDFDETGFGLNLSWHTPVVRGASTTLLLGADLGVGGHDSDVRGVEENEDLTATFIYLGPSAKLAFGPGDRTQFSLDAGVGYYWVSIDESEDDCFWECDIFEYYDDSTLGGYAGASVGIPVGRDASTRLSFSARVHFVDFDDPVELDNAASLGGPIYQFLFGAAFGL